MASASQGRRHLRRVCAGNRAASIMIQSHFHIMSLLTKSLARVFDVRHRPAPAVVHRLQGDAFERLGVRAILQNPAKHLEPLQVNELLRGELVGEFLLQHLGVRVAHPE